MAGTNVSIKALRKFLREPNLTPDEFVQHMRDGVGRNDRLIAVVGGSEVEQTFADLLKSRMPNGAGLLFDPKGALSTFSAKIDLAYALGLIDKDVRRNADYIREIRNVFAHRIGPTYFRIPEIATVRRLLALGDSEWRPRVKTNMRLRYHYACQATELAIADVCYFSEPPPASLQRRRSPPPQPDRQDSPPNQTTEKVPPSLPRSSPR